MVGPHCASYPYILALASPGYEASCVKLVSG